MEQTAKNLDASTLKYDSAARNVPAYNPVLHRLAQLTAVATLVLIFMGGLVTSHNAGMSVPDWPNSYGYNMFTFPISQWVGGIFYEHTHRLMGTVVGFASVLLVLNAWAFGRTAATRKWLWMATGAAAFVGACCAVQAQFIAPATRDATPSGSGAHELLIQAAVGFAGVAVVLGAATFMRRREPRRWVRWLAVGVLAAVLFQGLLGGLRVVLVNLDLAIIHACVAQAFLCLTALMAIVVSRWWTDGYREHPEAARGIVRLVAICTIAIYLQLIAGALMRHYQAGLAIPDFPLSYGQPLPPTDQAGLDAVNQIRAAMPNPMGPVSLWQIWLHFSHRIGAVVVTCLLIWTIAKVLLNFRHPVLRLPAIFLALLLPTQITLGILTVLWQKPADVASLHVLVGAMTLVTTFTLLVRSARLYSPRWRGVSPYLEIRVTPNRSIIPA